MWVKPSAQKQTIPMKHLYYLLAALCLLAQRSASADTVTNSSPNTLTRWERAARENKQLTENITWLTHEPLDFLLRRGDHFDDEPERYARMASTAPQLEAQGNFLPRLCRQTTENPLEWLAHPTPTTTG
jgi:hypothetical protein